jgi:hypothetical protein
MKIFDQTEKFPNKVNFVDENNVILGYDMYQCCCEYASWYISDREDACLSDCNKWGRLSKDLPDEDQWVFDTNYLKADTDSALDEGGVATFRIVNGHRKKYIHLFNCHNGYYAHGFKFETPHAVILESHL